ncbi:hypothetical protein B296_00038943 [Ensete ventricosum]|uniref:Uncharacterized protein n=1 Tax=Ensete ventricosum TaxID=4639 RepID=A0A426YRN9_ENSVE|nr:hypothetical protein B296_00038943 [Ensete ventricosum]
MDAEELRRMLRSSGVDLWALLETAVAVAAADHAEELRVRRDGIVERLYAPPAPLQKEEKGSSSPVMKTVHREDDAEDVEVNVEKRNILAIKKSLEYADQVTRTNQETSDSACISDSSPRLRRKWKDLVDGWVKSTSAGDSTASPAILGALLKPHQNISFLLTMSRTEIKESHFYHAPKF